ncbi:MAG: SPFH domain-containing protein [Oscillospiraceae bacterium]|nr:SPFH domain-containing protein [Oscillospiraceae bacterium]
MQNSYVNKENKSGKFKSTGIIIIIVLLLILLIVAALNSYTIVPSGHTGVITKFGKVDTVVLDAGFHLKNPITTKVIMIDNRVLKSQSESDSVSKDLQRIISTIAINYRVDKNQSANLYQNVGTDAETVIINPSVQECVKSVTAKFTAEELITNRQSVSDQMKESLDAKLASYGIVVEMVNIVNFGFSDEFNQAIEAKQVAQQQALKAEQDLERIKVEAQQKVAEAQGEADATETKADAEAYAIRVVQEQLNQNPNYIEYKKIDKWDGKLPQVSGANSSPIIDFRTTESTTNNTGG